MIVMGDFAIWTFLFFLDTGGVGNFVASDMCLLLWMNYYHY